MKATSVQNGPQISERVGLDIYIYIHPGSLILIPEEVILNLGKGNLAVEVEGVQVKVPGWKWKVK